MHQNKNNKLINRLFYWNENNRYLFSRTKVLTFFVFIFTFIPLLSSFPVIYPFMVALLSSGFVFVIGFLIHKIVKVDSSFYRGGFLEDLKHFLFYWHDKPDKFRLSKSKIITFIIIMMGFITGLQGFVTGNGGGYFVAYMLMSLVFAVPIFLLGLIISFFKSNFNSSNPTVEYNTHNDNADHTENYETSSSDVNDDVEYGSSSNHVDYEVKAKELKKDFDKKELKTRKLIETKFSPPQITYDRFMDVVDECSEIFNEQYLIVLDLCNLSKDNSLKIENEINSKINILKSIADKLDDLSSELVISMSKTSDDDIGNVLGEMEDLISSINDYKN